MSGSGSEDDSSHLDPFCSARPSSLRVFARAHCEEECAKDEVGRVCVRTQKPVGFWGHWPGVGRIFVEVLVILLFGVGVEGLHCQMLSGGFGRWGVAGRSPRRERDFVRSYS
jgi:hypothetical protein